jgi:hypothetical protein
MRSAVLDINKLQDGFPRCIKWVYVSKQEVSGQRLRGAIERCRNEIDIVQRTGGRGQAAKHTVNLHCQTASERPTRNVMLRKLLKCPQGAFRVSGAQEPICHELFLGQCMPSEQHTQHDDDHLTGGHSWPVVSDAALLSELMIHDRE